jgi:hypothetical protein
MRSFKKQHEVLGRATSTTNDVYIEIDQENSDDDDDDDHLVASDDNDYGYKHPPLIDIPYENQISDLLHMKNRMTDILFVCLINNFSSIDVFTNNTIFNPTKHTNLSIYIEEVKTTCHIGINPVGYSIKGIKNIFKSLTGDQRLRILKEIKRLFEGVLDHADRIEWLWTWLYEILHYFSTHTRPVDPENVKARCQQWLKVFIDAYPNKHVTPYMHRFAMHLHKSYRNHTDVNLFNLQGFEKTNDILRQRYMRSSNKKRKYIKQILQKSLRISYLEIELDRHFVARVSRRRVDGDI